SNPLVGLKSNYFDSGRMSQLPDKAEVPMSSRPPAQADSCHSTCPCCHSQLQLATRRINRDLSRRGFVPGACPSPAAAGLFRPQGAKAAPSPAPSIVFSNFQLFDGVSKALRRGLRLHVEGNRIKLISPGNPIAPNGAQLIDCGGRVLMPGLIDMHWHTMF